MGELDSSFDAKWAQIDRQRLAADEEREAEWYRKQQLEEASPVREEDIVESEKENCEDEVEDVKEKIEHTKLRRLRRSSKKGTRSRSKRRRPKRTWSW